MQNDFKHVICLVWHWKCIQCTWTHLETAHCSVSEAALRKSGQQIWPSIIWSPFPAVLSDKTHWATTSSWVGWESRWPRWSCCWRTCGFFFLRSSSALLPSFVGFHVCCFQKRGIQAFQSQSMTSKSRGLLICTYKLMWNHFEYSKVQSY